MQLHGWEAALFYVLAIMTLFMAVFVVTARVAVHSALFLISTLVNVALLFILLRAEFVAGVQILVYVGGVMVVFLFVIMLVNVGSEERGSEEIFNHPRQVTTSVIFCALLVGGLLYAINLGYEGLQKRDEVAVSAAAEQRTADEQKLPPAATG